MTIAAFLLAAVLAPAPASQEPAPAPQEPAAPAPQEPAAQPAAEPEPAETAAPAAGAGGAQEHIDAGLKAFKRRRFSAAQAEFQKALDADPQSAAAAFYLGYAHYKIAEPTRRNVAGKQKAAELFAKAFELDPAFKPVWGGKN
jgi:tetratricopeptide (TPR) repeat protein